MDTAVSLWDVSGPPGAPAIVLVHGAAWTRKMWLPQMQALSDQWRLIALDLPGHGALQAEAFSLERAERALQRAVAEAGGGHAIIVGLSLGGYVAIAFAAHHPDSCAGLVLSGCCVDYRGPLGIFSQLDATVVTHLFGAARLAHMQSKSVRSNFPADLAQPQVDAGFFFGAMPAVYRELRSHDFRELLSAWPGPTLLLNGERDALNRRGERAMLRAARAGRPIVIPGAGHLCNLEAAAAFTAAVRDFAAIAVQTA